MTAKGKLCYSFIPARVIFVILNFFGIALVHSYKSVLSIAIVAMIRHVNSTDNFTGHECSEVNESHSNSNSRGEFDWDDHQRALILGAYFYGYIILQIPAGIFSERLGAKWIFGFSILITAMLSLLGPSAARWGFIPFFITRFLQGLAQGMSYPCMNAMIARWMPKMERSRATSVILSGAALGTLVTMPLTGYLCAGSFMDGWPAIFYVLGIAGLIWFFFWTFFHFETPDVHPYISKNEVDFITNGQGDEKAFKNQKIPWVSIFSSLPVYALIITSFGQEWGFLTILTLLPTYFNQILHLDIKKNGMISSLPYMSKAIISWIASYISDKIREKGKVSATLIRKVNNSIAFFGTALCLIAVVLSKCNATASIIFFIIALGLNGCCSPGYYSNLVDMAPSFAATLMGITNSIANTSGFIAPSVAAIFYSKGHTLVNWSYVFYLAAIIYVITQMIYILFSTAELQSWALTGKKNQRDDDNKCKENIK